MNKKTFLRLSCIILAVFSGFNLLSCLAAFLVRNVRGGLSFNVTKASTIGMIGGADGPTSVFITAIPVRAWEPLIWLALFCLAFYGLSRCRKGK